MPTTQEVIEAIDQGGHPKAECPENLMEPEPSRCGNIRGPNGLLDWVACWANQVGVDRRGMDRDDAIDHAWDMAEAVCGEGEIEAVWDGNGGGEPGTDESQAGLGTFGGGTGRRTGRVFQAGGVGSAQLRAEASAGDDLPPGIRTSILDATRDALGPLTEFVPNGVDVAAFTFSNGTDPEIEQLSVSYDPVTNAPEEINSFEWRGNTTPVSNLDHDIVERYSYCGPPMAEIRTDFTPFERDEPVDVSALGPGSMIVPGPTTGTIKPFANSPFIQTPGGQVVGIDQSVLDPENLCLYVEIVQMRSTGDWTVMLDVRGENEGVSAPRVGVDVAVAGGIPPTRAGAFNSAFEIMQGNSPSGIFTDVVEVIDSNPEVAAPTPEAEDELEEDFEELATDGGLGDFGNQGNDDDDGQTAFQAGGVEEMDAAEAAEFVRDLNRRGQSSAVSSALRGRSVDLPTGERSQLRDAIDVLGEERAAQIAGVSLPDDDDNSAFTGQQSLGQSATQSLSEFGQEDQ